MRMETREKSLDKIYKRRSRTEIPDYQRGEVWKKNKKQLFIDSLMNGWHVPKLYFRLIDKEDEIYECVDGQQRLTAIYEFYEDKLYLPESAKNLYGGITYHTFKLKYQEKFDDSILQITEIEDASDSDMETLFLRLQLGTPLNTAEKLNAIGGKLRDFLKNLVNHDFFNKATKFKNTRYAHFVISCKMAYLLIYQIPSQLRQSELEKMLSENKDFNTNSGGAKKIKKILDILFEIFNDKPKLLSNRANLLSVFYFINQFDHLDLVKKYVNDLSDFFVSFFDLLEEENEKGAKSTNAKLRAYQDAISRNTDSKDAIMKRNDILNEFLLDLKPKLFSQFLKLSPDKKSLSVKELSEKIANLIVEANRVNIDKNAEDKIKLTPETTLITSKLSKVVRSDKDFKELIDFLYKLIYEGSGNGKRLYNKGAQIISDINYIRTDIRHEWRHGDKQKIRYKAKKIKETYQKYTSKSALSLLAAEDLYTFQVKLFNNLIDFIDEEINHT